MADEIWYLRHSSTVNKENPFLSLLTHKTIAFSSEFSASMPQTKHTKSKLFGNTIEIASRCQLCILWTEVETMGTFLLMIWPRQYLSHLINKSQYSSSRMFYSDVALDRGKADSSVRVDLIISLETVLAISRVDSEAEMVLITWGVVGSHISSQLDTEHWN